MTEQKHFDAIRWPKDIRPSQCAIHFTNELEVAASPAEVWAVLTDTSARHLFYPGVQEVEIQGGGKALRLGHALKRI